MAELEEKLKRLAAKPGVYLFRDEQGAVLDVGKAKSLRPRAREGQRREGERTTKGALERTTTAPGRVACTNVTESL